MQVPPVAGQPQPVFQYFSVLLEKGKLNQLESVELAKPGRCMSGVFNYRRRVRYV
jgi:hypothetical protein